VPGAQPPVQVVVTAVFDDEVRAEQAAAALHVWARANRRLRLGSVAVVARKPSGATVFRQKHVVRPGRGALMGMLAGLALLALPAAGAGALAAWVVGGIVLGLLGLVGVIPGGDREAMTFTVVVAAATIAALLLGLVGALIGCLVGAVVGLVDTGVRGMRHAEAARTLATLPAGSAATVMRTATPGSPLVVAEMARLGGAVSLGSGPATEMAPAAVRVEGGETAIVETPDPAGVRDR
jgi:hypothetical protein